jgi:folate-binding protein YgfZ
VPAIVAATADRFVPQMLNFELLKGIDFQKGCYTGQEVVARSQYRGTIKRRSFLFDTPAEPRPGDEVFHSADPGQPCGMVVDAAGVPGGGGSTALVEVKLAALGDGSIHLGAPGGPLLTRRPMPYDVPLDEVA